jgi:hypothetical protein
VSRVVAAIVTLWCAVAWLPFPAGFLLVRLLDPRQGDRVAFANGVAIGAVASLPTLLLWLVALLVTASRTRRLPGLGVTIGLLLGAGLIGVFLSAAIGGALAPWGSLVGVPAAGVVVLLLLTAPLAYVAVRGAFGLSGDTSRSPERHRPTAS